MPPEPSSSSRHYDLPVRMAEIVHSRKHSPDESHMQDPTPSDSTAVPAENVMPREDWISLRGLRFHYIECGCERGEGVPIVLLHGLASTAHIWDLVAPRFGGSRVVALNQRGHGLSDHPESGYDFATVVADVAGFVAALGLAQPVVVGHSWGANVALQYAVDHDVSGLVLVDGGFVEIGTRPGMTWECARVEMTPPMLCGLALDTLIERTRDWLGPAWSPSAVEILLHSFSIRPDRTVCPRLQREQHMQIARALWEQRPSELFPRVRCPVLLVPAVQGTPPGKIDQPMAANHEVLRAERLLSRSRTVWMYDTVHDIPLHRPRELAKAIQRFIAEDCCGAFRGAGDPPT